MANNNDTNLYNILGCNEDATIDDIRKNYKKLALQCHPDKRNQQQSTNDDNDDVGHTIRPEFSQLNQAATILSDKHSKFCYDSTLLAKKLPETIINDEINRQDFYKDDNGNLVYDCRCGGHFRIIDSYCPSQSTSSSQSMIIIDCDCCSLSVRLID
uniref:DPH4 homolog n=1 Tax=Dermatophagoides pteronyssinus TaxID=6956 RepID=A0A6P6XPF9_DERPT|nr:DPH4 homolog [Dermatophagoides pteronyssinus]